MRPDNWTTFGADLTRLVEDVLHAIRHRPEDTQELALGALYARAFQSFLGSINSQRQA